MAELFDRDEFFDAFVQAMGRPRRPLALLGAGTSVDAGYPDWNGLLAALKEKAKGMIPHKHEIFVENLKDPAWEAEEYRRIIGEDAFCDVIGSMFSPRGQVGNVLRVISQMGFRHILTTNYDSCIEQAFNNRLRVVEWTHEADLREFFVDLSADPEIPYLLYLHGRYDDPAKVILTESSYAARYVRSDEARSKLLALFLTQPVVFIGFSVTDPDINHLMREVNAKLGTGKPQHFALIGYDRPDEKEFIRNRFQGKFGIAPVFYHITKGPGSHRGLVDLLSAVHQVIHGRALELGADAIDVAAVADLAGADAVAPLHDPLDQQKGRWGGRPDQNGRVLRVANAQPHPQGEKQLDVLEFDLIVEAESKDGKPLEGEVTFHLHQTFHPSVWPVPVEDGRAVLRVDEAYGAFTVGAQTDGGATTLELDLAHEESLPQWFRER
ncbi:MAG TPA: SIR2 family protein [Longimicrobium sp.]|jgi:hypothetical protein|uniref:SIR2 family protein n=1 Tax=Longimicrobium sp. TaxID=2029185 RepID=UPI002EDBAD96